VATSDVVEAVDISHSEQEMGAKHELRVIGDRLICRISTSRQKVGANSNSGACE
jgi:hypothetical protein